VGGARLALGALALALLAARERGLRRHWLAHGRELLLGGVAVAAYQLAWFAGLRRTGVALGTVIGIASCPMFAGALAALAGGERMSRAWCAGTAIALGGVMLVVARTPAHASGNLLGIGCMLTAGLSYAIYARSAKRMIEGGLDSTGAMAGMFGLGALLVLPLAAREPLAWLLTARGSALALHLGVVTIGVAYWLYGWALRHLAVPAVATLTLAEPAVAALLGVGVLGERIGTGGWTGVLVVSLGLAIAQHE
jgi:DME family drug/metabolite transporter